MVRMRVIVSILAATCVLQAQNPLSDELRESYTEVKNNIIRSAEKMPEENYSFRPTPRGRTFGEILAHIAQEQYLFFCTPLKGEHKAVDIEKTKTAKADLLTAARILRILRRRVQFDDRCGTGPDRRHRWQQTPNRGCCGPM